MNNFIDNLTRMSNYAETENGAIAHKSTLSKVYDMFAFGGSYRTRTEEDCILLFKNALEEDETLAMKCLFYLRDIRGGQGERRFFRVCFHWLAKNYKDIASRNLKNLVEYGRWDDLYCIVNTPLEKDMFDFIKEQIEEDIESFKRGSNEGVSLLAKWLKSENASSKETKKLGQLTRKYLKLSHKEYRKMLSMLRTRINIVEKLMSENRWNEIEFDKLPSKAGIIYRNAFAHRDIISKKYSDFMANKDTKVNASSLYPYEIVKQVTDKMGWYSNSLNNMSETERDVINKYWENQKDYLGGKRCKAMCVVDTSGSMDSAYGGSTKPIDVAISLGMYCAERIGEPFKDYFISFSRIPKLIKIEGVDTVDKIRRIYSQNLCENTDLLAVFNLFKRMIDDGQITAADLPESLIVISDMEIDSGSYWRSKTQVITEMETIRQKWAAAGLTLPHLVYWNCAARNNIILDGNENTTYVSGCSPVIFESILTGKTGISLMLDKLNSERYEQVK